MDTPDLDISELSFRRAANPLSVEITRELSAQDLVVRASSEVATQIPTLKSLRATHHKLANLLSMGVSEGQASLATGYSLARISVLKHDPAFKELLAFYAGRREEVYVDVQDRMAGFATDALEVLQERLAEKPDTFSVKDLNNLIKTTADRGGYAPVQRTENKTITMTAQDLIRMKQEVQGSQNGQIRKINQVEEAQRVKAFLTNDSGPPVSGNDNRPAEDAPEETPPEGEPGPGANI